MSLFFTTWRRVLGALEAYWYQWWSVVLEACGHPVNIGDGVSREIRGIGDKVYRFYLSDGSLPELFRYITSAHKDFFSSMGLEPPDVLPEQKTAVLRRSGLCVEGEDFPKISCSDGVFTVTIPKMLDDSKSFEDWDNFVREMARLARSTNVSTGV